MSERASHEQGGEQDEAASQFQDGGETSSAPPTQFSQRGAIPPVAAGNEMGGGESASDKAFGANVSNSLLPDWATPKSWKPTILRKFPKPHEHGGEMPPPPPKYAAMHRGAAKVLWRSQDDYAPLKAQGPEVDFWDKLDKLDPSPLQVLVQVMVRAEQVGLGPLITTVKTIYNCGSSWGIHFQSSGNPLRIALNGKWGKDASQALVRKEHDGTAHEWYRQDSGAGNSGLHLGIDDGAGDHNLHVDPTNPMAFVSKGVPVPGPDGMDEPLYPFGIAVYDPKALIDHAKEIDAYPKWLPGGDQPHAAPKPRASEPWFTIDNLPYEAKVACGFADEEAAAAKAPDSKVTAKDNAARVQTQLHVAEAAVQALRTKSRDLAMRDNTGNEAAVEALKAETAQVVTALFTALTDFFKHMHAEGGNAPGKYDPRELSTWLPFAQNRVGPFGGDCRNACVEARKKRAGS